MVKTHPFGQVVLSTKKVKSIKAKDYLKNGRHPIIDQGADLIGGYTDSDESLYKGQLPVVVFGDHTRVVKYIDFPFCVGADGTKVLRPNTELIEPKYLYYAILSKDLGSLGYSRHFKLLKETDYSVPDTTTQERISSILDTAVSLREKRKRTLKLLDNYIESVFIQMFGDMVTNPKKWDKVPLSSFGEVITGNTPPRNDPQNYSDNHIEWVKTDNIVGNKLIVTPAKEYLSKTGVQKARTVEPGALLITCIAGSASSIGRCAMTDRKISFNQQINAIQPNSNTDSMYLYWLIRVSKAYILSYASTGMKKIITKGVLQKIELPLPPLNSQKEFSEIAKRAEQTKQRMLHQSIELDNLFTALLGTSFNT